MSFVTYFKKGALFALITAAILFVLRAAGLILIASTGITLTTKDFGMMIIVYLAILVFAYGLAVDWVNKIIKD